MFGLTGAQGGHAAPADGGVVQPDMPGGPGDPESAVAPVRPPPSWFTTVALHLLYLLLAVPLVLYFLLYQICLCLEPEDSEERTRWLRFCFKFILPAACVCIGVCVAYSQGC